MGVVHEDVRTERLGDDVDHRPVIEQPHEPTVLSEEREEMQRRRCGAGAVPCPDSVDCLAKVLDEGGIERSGKADVAVLVEA